MPRFRPLLFLVVAVAATRFPYFTPLLEFQNGSAVSSPEQWTAGRRQEVSKLLQDHLLGTMPLEPPPSPSSEVLNVTKFDGGSTSSFVRLSFDVSAGGATSSVSFEIEVLYPITDVAVPLFLTQWNHREWAVLGLSRGYAAVVYPGADTRDAAPDFQRAYPQHSMMLIAARAFVVSRVLDYALSEIQGLAPGQVAITGHSRNGKQSLIAAAFDERITAVVGSSPGAPISSPFAFSSHNFYGEGPDAGHAGNWWLDSITAYTARPHMLPMDGHGVLALVAPRACAVADAWTDHEGDSTFADEMGARAAGEVFELLGAAENMRLIHRPGDHHGFIDVNTYFDWFDHAFGRTLGHSLVWAGQAHSMQTASAWPQTFLTPAGFDWEVWNNAFGGQIEAPPAASAPLVERVSWLLQLSEPIVRSIGSPYAEEGTGRFTYTTMMMGNEAKSGVKRVPVSFGGYVTANVYWPDTLYSSEKPLPAVVWLHPYSYATGYCPAYGSSNIVQALAKAGFVVIAYDQIGHAQRIREGGTTFYDRHGGNSSLFGHMVRDARAAVDFLMCRGAKSRTAAECNSGETYTSAYKNTLEQIPAVDPNMIVAAGYSLGGNVALHATALDKRIAAVAAFAAFTPMRTDTEDRPTFGLRRLYDLHALLPRLGLFAGSPSQVPYDYDELLGSIAPRPTLLYTPQQDRDATFADVRKAIDSARSAWGERSALLNHTAPDTYTVMSSAETNSLVAWARSLLASNATAATNDHALI